MVWVHDGTTLKIARRRLAGRFGAKEGPGDQEEESPLLSPPLNLYGYNPTVGGKRGKAATKKLLVAVGTKVIMMMTPNWTPLPTSRKAGVFVL